MRCELKDGTTRMHLVFSSFSTEICELKDEKARMHNVHPGSHPPEFVSFSVCVVSNIRIEAVVTGLVGFWAQGRAWFIVATGSRYR